MLSWAHDIADSFMNSQPINQPNQSSQNSGIDRIDDLKTPPLPDLLLADHSCWMRGLSLSVGPLVGFLHSSGWPHSRVYMGSNNWT